MSRYRSQPAKEAYVRLFPLTQHIVDRFRRPMDGSRLGYRSHSHGGHHYRLALDTGGIQHRFLHTAPFRPEGGVARQYYGTEDAGTGPLGVLGNIIWLVLAGWWLALGHLITAILLAVTIVGIPFAWAHLKLASVALWPIGKIIVLAEDAPLRYPRGR